MQPKQLSTTVVLISIVCMLMQAAFAPMPEATTPEPEATMTASPVPTEETPAAVSTLVQQETPPQPSEEPPPTTTIEPQPAVYVQAVEPGWLPAAAGGTITLTGAGFSEGLGLRLVGAGALQTSFINASLMKATVPGGLPPGLYDLQLIDGNGTAFTLTGALELVPEQSTPTATLPPAPPSGEPVLVLCGYSTHPDVIKPGSEFRAVIYICNAGNQPALQTLVSFTGGTFITSGDARHIVSEIHPGKSARIEQEFKAPTAVPPGTQTLSVQMNTSDSSGANYAFQQTVNVEISQALPNGGGSASRAAVRLLVVSCQTAPEHIQPGQSFELRIGIQNLGKADANEVMVRPAGNGSFMMNSGQTMLLAGQIPAGTQTEITLPMLAGAQLTPGIYSLDIDVHYRSAAGENSITQAVNLGVQTSLGKKPKLIITGYRTEPEQINPGTAFDLYLELVNTGADDARQAAVMLGGENGLELKPFSPVGSGNVKFIPALAPGELTEISFKLMADGSSDARAFNLPVALAFNGPDKSQYTDMQVVSLMVYKQPMLRVDFFEAVKNGEVGSPLRLPIEVINLSSDRINIVMLSISSEKMDISSGSAYVGRLDSGGTFSLEASGRPLTSGWVPILVTIEYVDSYNQVQQLTFELGVDVEEKAGASGEVEANFGASSSQPVTTTETFWQKLLRILRGFFGFGS
jgi:hypothetical protein